VLELELVLDMLGSGCNMNPMSNAKKITTRASLIESVTLSLHKCVTATSSDAHLAMTIRDSLAIAGERDAKAEAYMEKLDVVGGRGWARLMNELKRIAERTRSDAVELARSERELDEIAALIGESANRDAIADAVRTYGFHTVRTNVRRALAAKS